MSATADHHQNVLLRLRADLEGERMSIIWLRAQRAVLLEEVLVLRHLEDAAVQVAHGPQPPTAEHMRLLRHRLQMAQAFRAVERSRVARSTASEGVPT